MHRIPRIMTNIRWSFRLSQWEPSSSNVRDVDDWSKIISSIQPEEIQRINGFYFKESSKSAAIGRLMIRRAIVEMTNLKWSDFKLGRTLKGKPILVNESGQPIEDLNFSFNMSHHGDFVAVVCGNASSCGVDVMKIEVPTFKKTVDQYLNFMKSKFSCREFSNFEKCSNDYDKLVLFYRYWCLKESYLKATGTGIHSKLNSLDFEIKTFGLTFNQTCQDTVLWINDVRQPYKFEECWIDKDHIAAICLSLISTITMPEQSSHPLERFLILAKSAKNAAAANLILQVIDSPNIYVFAELFSSPNIAELEKSVDFKPYFDLLQIFAFGLYSDYAKNAAYFSKIPVNNHMIDKLRELTIVSLAKERKRLPYVLLLKELALSNVRELEDLIIDAIYNNVIVGKLDQKNQTLEIESCAGRDVKIEELSRIREILESFTERCHVMLSNMEQEMDTANRLKSDTVQHRQKQEQEFENLKKTLKAANQNAPEFYGAGYGQHETPSSSSGGPGHHQLEPPEKKKDKMGPKRSGVRAMGGRRN